MTVNPKILPLKFPRDGQAHNSIIEWWYFNGHLKDKKGNAYAFMDSLFKADTSRVKIPFLVKVPFKTIYFSHSILSDIKKQKSYSDIQHVNIVSEDSFTKPLLSVYYTNPLLVNGYSSYIIEETKPFTYHIKGVDFDLILASKKAPMRNGGRGHVTVNGRDSYYYSLTNLETKGLIRVDDNWIEVKGKSWMDHQWADVSYAKDKWSWFSLQLDSDMEIMCCQYGMDDVTNLVDISDVSGQHESAPDLILKPGRKLWRSPVTKASYPLSWHIQILSKNIDLQVEALMREQEMVFGAINYWEGPLKVLGTVGGKKVKGLGFMELVGYPSNYSNTALIAKEIRVTFNREWHRSTKLWRGRIFKK